jgi:flavin-dependent dehydrogenase
VLARAGIAVEVFERKHYPFHRVCGEYISMEVAPFLKSLSLYPEEFTPSQITRLQLTSVNGKSTIVPLDMGGFGISRFSFDNFLMKRAQQEGVIIHQGTEVTDVNFSGKQFEVQAAGTIHHADVVIGSFGKRSKLDVQWKRIFIKKRSPYVGVKYHIKTNHPPDLISLHNFKSGYLGMSAIEDGKTNICYLSHRSNLKANHAISDMEKNILFQNPFIKSVFENSEFLFEKPEVINEISFETKLPVENHILMVGDAAGMITPLCGNGMAMAVHSAKMVSNLVMKFCSDQGFSRQQLEQEYTRLWQNQFASRLWAGRQIQRLFGGVWSSNLAVAIARYSKPTARFLIGKTHGKAI